jgi:hypothetical protein
MKVARQFIAWNVCKSHEVAKQNSPGLEPGLSPISANLFCCNNLDYVLAVFGHERRGGGW